MDNKKEVWLRNEPLPNISPLLQPVANALLEAAEEIESFLIDFPSNKLWTKPAGCASVGFHLLHIVGFLDRLFTYAQGNQLSETQLDYLASENQENISDVNQLIANTLAAIQLAVQKLTLFPENILTEKRFVGRAMIPTTTIGLLFHAAEHTMRHTGQLLVTIKVVKQNLA